MHVCFHRALLACALPVTIVRMPARRASSHLLVIARMYFMDVSMLDAIYVCFHRALLVCALFSRRACSHARPPYIIAFARVRKDIAHACMNAGRYVCMLPPRSACLCAIFPSPVARARMLARRTSSRLIVITSISFMHVCVLDAMYVRCRRVSHARATVSYTHLTLPTTPYV